MNSSILTAGFWEITWEYRLAFSSNKVRYRPACDTPFFVKLAPDGSVYHNGFKGLWRWQLDATGQMLIYIGGDYPVGTGRCLDNTSDEMLVCFSEDDEQASNGERMRWRRQQ